MDAIEIARRSAANLHAQAVASGLDPTSPFQFAVAEAQRRGFDVEPSGVETLRGSRATLIAEDRLILYENIGTPFEQAFLVAHEIGHAELGDGSNYEPAQNIDSARSAEPSPVGIDRVVDYSPRQRREIQMDLFAREFLLPRFLVRTLHVEQGLTVSQIAERFGAPFEVVAQQLLDALLLPPVSEERQVEVVRPLNELQAAAANHRGKPHLLEAGPGTGKTQTLIARVVGLLADAVDPRRILLLTFSNKAAGEMAERIASRTGQAASAMWVGTFHAFGLDLIRRFNQELRLPANPRLLDRTEAVALLEAEFPRLPLVHYRNLTDPTQNIVDILTAISRAKDEVTDAPRYLELASAMLEAATTPEERKGVEKAIEVALVYQAYETLKQKAGCIDFGDLVLLPVLLLERNPAIRESLASKYDHVLVDEYQDVNRSSVRLLQALCGDGEDLWVVGDAKQSIYRFRGASSFNMARFGQEDFPGGERGWLRRNYRSVPEVVELFSEFASSMAVGTSDPALVAQREPSGFEPQLCIVTQADEQTVAVANAIEAMRSQGYSYRDQAVLCTGNARLANLARDLERLGVPVLFLGSLFECPEVKDVLALLSLLIDRRAMGLLPIACWPEFAMSLADVAAVNDYLRQNEDAVDGWLSNLQAIPNLTEVGCAALTQIAGLLAGFDEQSSPWVVLTNVLLERTRTAAQIASSENIDDRARGIALWQLMNFIRVQSSGQGLPIKRLLDRVRRLVRLGDDRDLRQLPAAAQGLDAVRLMTMHRAKGLEFPVVHLPGLNNNALPRSFQRVACPPPDGMVQASEGPVPDALRTEHAQEQECLFYVALSRAHDRLFLYAPTQMSDGKKWGLSSFLGRLGSALKQQSVTPSRTLPKPPEEENIELVIEGGLRFSESQISLYESCPRRFFYTHVLQLGGRRGETAYMQTHEAARTVIQEIIAGGVATMDTADLEQRVCELMAAQDLADHGCAEELKSFAIELINTFAAHRTGHGSESSTTLTLALGDDEIIIQPDDVLTSPDGSRKVRRIHTRHMYSKEGKDVGTAAFKLAVQRNCPDAAAEILYLSDQSVQGVTLSEKELQKKHKKLVGILSNIRGGRFPTEPSEWTCPGCPAFFICGETPAGALLKKF
jgi:superfamily I DNA/RNA helicase/Zn-dependent peptidase ImmA (M78 family)